MLADLKEKLKVVIKDYPQFKIDFKLRKWETDFLRFFHSQTNYNISKEVIELFATVYSGQKNYSFYINAPTEELVRERMNDTVKIIDKLPGDPHFKDIEKDIRKGAEKPKERNIDKMPLSQKVEILSKFAKALQPLNFEVYGTFICNHVTSYIVNSNGVDKMSEANPCYFEVKAVSNENQVTVLECFGGEDIQKIAANKMIDSLVEKAKLAKNDIVDVEAGEYEVILAPRCIGDLLSMYAWSSLQGYAIDREDTDLIGKEGTAVYSSYFTLTDSPSHPDVVNSEYSSEGYLLQDLPIFEEGVFKNFLVDNYYANKLDMKENGNSGACLVMKTGDSCLPDMIKSIKKGLYISSLHYVNFINPKETSLTGLTRDGTFLIENGQITKVVNNLRFTEKISSVLNHLTAIENKAFTFPQSENYHTFSISACSMPHVKVDGFKISSSTKTV
ncbi:MAG: TldD/PmbA family protein [Candidatus Cloacimonetes bacterium]|nr:TldD/PmbA family protein [Candidatus Cloacimonadota bacterium]